MSLGMIAGMMRACTKLQKIPAGEGGLSGRPQTYADGEAFRAMLVKAASPENHDAERREVRERYTVIVPRGVTLAFDDVFRREADGSTFRCLSATKDAEAPEISTVPIARCDAERWDLP